MNPVRTAARAMLASIFVGSGWNALRRPERLVDRAKPVADRVAPYVQSLHPSLPTDTATLVRANGAAQLVGGVLLATGRASRPAAALLAGTLVPTTLAGHPYWQFSDPEERAQHRTQFMKNLGLLGGLLLAALDTEGRPGLAWRTGHAARHAEAALRRATESTVDELRDTGRGVQRAARGAAREVERATSSARREVAEAAGKAAGVAGLAAGAAGRAADNTRRGARRASFGLRHSAKQSAREARLAVRAAKLGRRLPG